ncbi:MAG: hypothetical protein LUG99_20885 [Lachnospiraceae bacterium]|nr:hypothetical protein [Lachnospiraceae bacterium]
MRRVKKWLHSNAVIHRCLTDGSYKNRLILYGSLALNTLYAVWEILCGVYYRSFWFVTLGCYYILLSLVRLMLVKETRRDENKEYTEWWRYRNCGILLLLMNSILCGIVALAVRDNQGSHYAGYLIYAVATYTSCKVGIAIRNFAKNHDFKDPILTASKITSFASAVVSVLSLEIAMILQFDDDLSLLYVMTVTTGIGAGVLISAPAIYMIVTAQKNI